MWVVLWSVGIIAILLFGLVVFFGAPYLPTLDKRVDDALDMLDLKEGQTMLELGSGDGRLLIAAAKQGIYSIGYELNPLLWMYSIIKSWRYRKYVKIYCRNYWQVEWPKADGMYVFLLQPYMKRLDERLKQYPHKPLKLVSFAFFIEGSKPLQESRGMRLYKYR
jgi:hypothetical protein